MKKLCILNLLFLCLLMIRCQDDEKKYIVKYEVTHYGLGFEVDYKIPDENTESGFSFIKEQIHSNYWIKTFKGKPGDSYQITIFTLTPEEYLECNIYCDEELLSRLDNTMCDSCYYLINVATIK